MASERKGLPPLSELEEKIRREVTLAYEEKVERLKTVHQRLLEELREKYERAAREFAERAS